MIMKKNNMLKCALLLLMSIMLMTGCGGPIDQTDEAEDYSNRVIKEPIEFDEYDQSEVEWQIVEDLITDYENNLVAAINGNDFSKVEFELYPDSELYNDQKVLVERLNEKGVKERLVDFYLAGFSYDGDNRVIEVEEEIEIQYSDGEKVVKDFNWIYTAKKNGNKYQLSKIEKWADHDEDIEKRMGAVKADGYFLWTFRESYSSILLDAINTLHVVNIKYASSSDEIVEQHKDLITQLRAVGYNYEVMANNLLGSDDNRYDADIQLKYTDENGKAQTMTLKLRTKLEEVRSKYGSGHVEIVEMEYEIVEL